MDQGIEAAEPIIGTLHRVDDLTFVGHVGMTDVQPVGESGKLRLQGVERILVGVDHEHGVTAVEQPPHSGFADASGTACNDRRLRFHHAVHRSIFVFAD